MSKTLHRQTREWLRRETSPEQTRRTIHRLMTKLVEEGPGDVSEGTLARALPTWSTDEYAPAVARAVDHAARAHARLESERERATEELGRYLASRAGAAPATSEIDPSVSQTWAFVRGLVSENWEIDHPDPAQAVELAQTGVDLALKLDEGTYGAERVRDLRALAYAKLGNALRIRTELRDAEIAFGRSAEELAAGTGDPVVEARVRLAEVSFHGSQRRYEKAIHLVDRTVATARRFDDWHLLGKALLTRAFFESNAGHSDEAMRLSQRGLRFIDPSQEPRLVMVAWHNLVLTLTYQGRYAEAAEWLPHVRSLHERYGNRLDRFRLQWIEGKIDLAQGEQRRAEATLGRVRESFVEADVGFDAALVSLDLAHVYAQQGRSEDMRRLAREMIPIFESRDMHREAIAALLVFKRTTEMDQVSVRLVEDLTAFLRRARGNPKLQFQPRP